MPEIHLKPPGFTYNACGIFPKNKERIKKKICRQKIQIIFIGMIWIKLLFSMIWLMVNKQTWLKEQNQIKS